MFRFITANIRSHLLICTRLSSKKVGAAAVIYSLWAEYKYKRVPYFRVRGSLCYPPDFDALPAPHPPTWLPRSGLVVSELGRPTRIKSRPAASYSSSTFGGSLGSLKSPSWPRWEEKKTRFWEGWERESLLKRRPRADWLVSGGREKRKDGDVATSKSWLRLEQKERNKRVGHLWETLTT